MLAVQPTGAIRTRDRRRSRPTSRRCARSWSAFEELPVTRRALRRDRATGVLVFVERSTARRVDGPRMRSRAKAAAPSSHARGRAMRRIRELRQPRELLDAGGITAEEAAAARYRDRTSCRRASTSVLARRGSAAASRRCGRRGRAPSMRRNGASSRSRPSRHAARRRRRARPAPATAASGGRCPGSARRASARRRRSGRRSAGRPRSVSRCGWATVAAGRSSSVHPASWRRRQKSTSPADRIPSTKPPTLLERLAPHHQVARRRRRAPRS